MAIEEDETSLAMVAESQRALHAKFDALSAEQARVYRLYEENSSSYQARTEAYLEEHEATRVVRAVHMAIRVATVLLLAYIAYRVSR
jgi:hypothetical protein